MKCSTWKVIYIQLIWSLQRFYSYLDFTSINIWYQYHGTRAWNCHCCLTTENTGLVVGDIFWALRNSGYQWKTRFAFSAKRVGRINGPFPLWDVLAGIYGSCIYHCGGLDIILSWFPAGMAHRGSWSLSLFSFEYQFQTIMLMVSLRIEPGIAVSCLVYRLLFCE